MGKIKIEIKWALIFIFMSLIWMLLERLTGLHSTHIDKHAVYTNFMAVPAIAVYVFALLDKRKIAYNGSMSYLKGFSSGLIITLIVTIFSPLTQYITSAIITPDFFTNMIQYVVNEGKMTQEAALNYFSLKNYIIQGLIGAPIMGIITSGLVALFTKKTAPNTIA